MAKKTKATPKGRPVLTAVIITVCILAAILLLIWLCKPGPVDKLEKAAENTLLADNFTAKFDLDINGEKADGTIKAAIDPAAKTLEMYMQLTTYISDYECGIYDNNFVVCTAATGDISSVDISDRTESFFLLLEENGDPDWSVLLDLSETDLYDTLSKDFDFDILLSCLGQWLNKLNSTDWAKKYAGFSKDTANGIITYRFEPDLYTLALETAPMFRSAFLQESRYEALNEYLEDAKYLLKDGCADLTVSVKNGVLSSASFTLGYFNTQASCDVSFSDIGTTVVDSATVASYIQQANE